ncbi:hypothetical protein GH714_022682 [Hevea brasiliensis]|uniref:Vacuolar protein sorting-associated protein 51 homolog n=1 Tax=Hevea brasiliensis TaxID=3981 RepID=A0A6A6NIR5_HEVBR|nr:hypothetical protein GH714_022682 [Hevea brasiliensis]
MGVDDVPLDDKAKRMRDLLSSFYSPDPAMSSSNSSKFASLDAINTTSFDADQYMNLLVQKSNLEGLLQKHVEMAAEIKNLDTDLQMLVYENYNKFISATDTIKRMKNNIVGMEANMEQLLEKGKLFSDTESIQARAEAAVLLKQLDFPVDSLKAKLFEKLEQLLQDLQLKREEITNFLEDSNDTSKTTSTIDASVHEFAEAIKAYRVIFPDSEKQLIKLSQDLITKHFEITEQNIKEQISVAKFLGFLRVIWRDVLLMDEVLNEAFLPDYSLEAAQRVVKQYVAITFSHLLHDISDALIVNIHMKQKEGVEENPLQVALETSKNAVLKGSMDVLVDLRHLVDDNLGLLLKLRDSIVDWIQEGFQEFFRALDDHFLLLSGRNKSVSQAQGLTEGKVVDKVLAGLVLVLAQLSVFIEQTAVPKITEEIATSFSGSGVRGYENGPAFVPGEICRIFRSAGEKFLHHYITMRTQRVSVLLKKRFKAPNWVKHKEPREVHMFVDLLLQELETIGSEVKQVLSQGVLRKHRRSESNGSTASSRSNPLRDDKMSRTNTQRARSQLLETHLANCLSKKLRFLQKLNLHRLQTFNRSGFQQIQLDIQFLRAPLKETVEDEAAIDFLLDEVIVGTSERCLDPIPLEPPILDKLIQAKLAKKREQSAISL